MIRFGLNCHIASKLNEMSKKKLSNKRGRTLMFVIFKIVNDNVIFGALIITYSYYASTQNQTF